MAQRKTILTAISLMEEIYSHKKDDLSSQAIDTYTLLLEDIPDDMVIAGAKHYMASNKWFPSPADWRDACMEIINVDKPLAIDAWGEVKKAMSARRCDEAQLMYLEWDRLETESPEEYRAWDKIRKHKKDCLVCQGGMPQFSDPAITRVVEAMGWETLKNSDNEVADRAHFNKALAQVQEREQKEQVMLPEVKNLAKRLGDGKDGL